MREALTPYKRSDHLNYLCIAVMGPLAYPQADGRYTLEPLIALASGFESILSTLSPQGQVAIRNLRISGVLPATRRGLRVLIERYNQYHHSLEAKTRLGNRPADALDKRFEVREDLSFRPLWGDIPPMDVSEARLSLTGQLPLKQAMPPPLHDTTRPATFRVNKPYDYSATLRTVERIAAWPDLPKYDIARLQRQPGFIAWHELVEMADHFDAIDVQIGHQPEGGRAWFNRLHDRDGRPVVELLTGSAGSLVAADGIELSGIKHLIGLPGAGKTTLLYLLAGVLSRRGHQTCFLFPSIEVASAYVETLSRYQIPAGLLSGRSDRARARHVLNFAAGLASRNHGYGVTRYVAPFFATNCALAGFVASEDESPFPHRRPPCQQIKQAGQGSTTQRTHQCGLSSVCGMQYSERALATSTIWAGHVLSLDRSVSPLFVDYRLNHFEYVSRAFDLLIVDEADAAQSTLDSMGTPEMQLYGGSNSLVTKLLGVHGAAASGENAFIDSEEMNHILEMTARFARASERMTHQIQDSSADQWFAKFYSKRLLTTLSIISDMFPGPGGDDEPAARHARKREAFERMWDMASKDVAFRNMPLADAVLAAANDVAPAGNADDPHAHGASEDEEDREWRAIAEMAGIDVVAAKRFRDELRSLLETWDRDNTSSAMAEVVNFIGAIDWLPREIQPARFQTLARLLTTLSQVALQHFGLSPHLRLLSAEGLTDESVFLSKPSKDESGVLPDSIVGRLSGVRYTINDDGNVNISHIEFGSTPRLLPQRMAALGQQLGGAGPAVLLTSATSMLEDSPSFHIWSGPHYLLRRPNAGDGWTRSRYHFIPQTDPPRRYAPPPVQRVTPSRP